jgi:hypothetical protein
MLSGIEIGVPNPASNSGTDPILHPVAGFAGDEVNVKMLLRSVETHQRTGWKVVKCRDIGRKKSDAVAL